MQQYNYEELYHHGIPGMRWGVRRYQNKDGSLTEAGRRRQAINEEKQANKIAKLQAKRKVYDARAERKIAKEDAKQERKELEQEKKEKRQKIIKGVIAGAAAIGVTAYIVHKVHSGKTAAEQGEDATKKFSSDFMKGMFGKKNNSSDSADDAVRRHETVFRRQEAKEQARAEKTAKKYEKAFRRQEAKEAAKAAKEANQPKSGLLALPAPRKAYSSPTIDVRTGFAEINGNGSKKSYSSPSSELLRKKPYSSPTAENKTVRNYKNPKSLNTFFQTRISEIRKNVDDPEIQRERINDTLKSLSRAIQNGATISSDGKSIIYKERK